MALKEVLSGGPPDVALPASPAPDFSFLVPTIPTLQAPDPMSTPVHDHPAFTDAVRQVWNKQAVTGGEQSFNVNSRKPDGTPVIAFNRGISGKAKEEFSYGPNTTAILHSHPATMAGMPSPNDIAIGDKSGKDMYTIGREGLWLYKANSGKPPVLVKPGLDWLKPDKK